MSTLNLLPGPSPRAILKAATVGIGYYPIGRWLASRVGETRGGRG